jgi:hypothetical protein
VEFLPGASKQLFEALEVDAVERKSGACVIDGPGVRDGVEVEPVSVSDEMNS